MATERPSLIRRLGRPGVVGGFVLFTVLNTTIATLVVAASLDWSRLDAFYFVVTALTTVGFGDLNVAAAGPAMKLYVVYLMLCGAGSYSVLLALLIHRIVAWNLREYFEGGRKKMSHHVILCGLGNLGSRILEELQDQGEDVVCIEREENRFVKACRSRGSRVVIDDAKLPETLQAAGIGDARCIVIVTNDDLGNLEIALNAREANPDVRVVLRMYDRGLAGKLDRVFNFGSTLSASEIAAPTFANAVNHAGIAATVTLQEVPHLLYELDVRPGSSLDGLTCGEVVDRCGASVLSLRRDGTTSSPRTDTVLTALDGLVVGIQKEGLDRLLALNAGDR